MSCYVQYKQSEEEQVLDVTEARTKTAIGTEKQGHTRAQDKRRQDKLVLAIVNHARNDMIMVVYHLFDLFACAKRGTKSEDVQLKVYGGLLDARQRSVV